MAGHWVYGNYGSKEWVEDAPKVEAPKVEAPTVTTPTVTVGQQNVADTYGQSTGQTVGQTVDAILANIGNTVGAVTQYLKDHANTDPAVAQTLKDRTHTEGSVEEVKNEAPKGNGDPAKGQDPNLWYDKNGNEVKNKAVADSNNANIDRANKAKDVLTTNAGNAVDTGVSDYDTASKYLQSLMMTPEQLYAQAQADNASARAGASGLAIGGAQDAAAVETQRERSMGLNAGQAGIGGGGVVGGVYQNIYNTQVQNQIDNLNKSRDRGELSASQVATMANNLRQMGLGAQESLAGLAQNMQQFDMTLETNQKQFADTLALQYKKLQEAGDAKALEGFANMVATVIGSIPGWGAPVAAFFKIAAGVK